MDCAIVVSSGDTRAMTVAMAPAGAGDRVVVGMRGVRVERPVMSLGASEFGFMSSGRLLGKTERGDGGSESPPASAEGAKGPALGGGARAGWLFTPARPLPWPPW